MHRVVIAATYLLLVGALAAALIAFCKTPDWDRASITFSLFAAVTGLVLDRWVSHRERRRELLRALANELHVVGNIFSSREMQPANVPDRAIAYARLPTDCLVTCLASGMFTEAADKRLLKLMYAWRQRANEFNEKLELTQDAVKTNDKTQLAHYHEKVTTGAVTISARERWRELITQLVADYKSLTGIDSQTVLLPD